MRIVLYFVPPGKSNSANAKLAGIRDIGARTDWQIQVVHATLTPANWRKLHEFWHPVGIIVECGEGRSDLAVFDRIRNLPTVFLDRDAATCPKRAFAIRHDSIEAGQIAARELMLTGFADFAYVPTPAPKHWSDERALGFSEALSMNGYTPTIFTSPTADTDSPVYNTALKDFLTALPKPCALFAANDSVAEKVLALANVIGLSVPDKLAVLGVDNREEICERTQPPLSSLVPDFHHAGALAALLLMAAVRFRRDFRGARTRLYDTVHALRRQSTRLQNIRSGNDAIDCAVELIRNEACNGLRAERVLQMLPYSRSVAAAKFREATGRSILQAIHAQQLARAKELLLNRRQEIKSIHDFCGFTNENSLRKFFLRETGMTMTQFRNQLKGYRTNDRGQTLPSSAQRQQPPDPPPAQE